MEDWLKNLKVGDKFYTEGRYGYSVHTVLRFTPKEIVTTPPNNSAIEGLRFNRETGWVMGTDSWNSIQAKELTQEIIEKLKWQFYSRKLNDFDFKQLNYKILLEIYKIVFNK
jgi:hypothetical protein